MKVNKFILLGILIIIIIILAVMKFNRRYQRYVVENFNPPTTTSPPPTTLVNILPDISSVINSGYNKLNTNRFEALDNQIRLDNLNTRVNKLVENIQKVFNM